MTELSSNRYITLKCIMTIMVIFVAYVRLPELLVEPRFWAEEGSNYFSFAYNHNLLVNFTSPQFGYYTLYNSIVTSLAAMAPLTYAPAITTYLAFIAQLSVSSAAIWWDIPILDSLLKKLVVALLIQTLAYPRIWATTIGVQYWLCILTLLILLHNHHASSGKMFVLQNCLLALNGLTGILSCLLIPSFVLKSVKTRSRRVIAHTAILIGCMIVQASVFVYAYMNNDGGLKTRFGDLDLLYVLNKMIRFLVTMPFFERYIFSSPYGEYLELAFRKTLSTITGPSIYSPKYNFYMLEMLLGLSIIFYLIVLACKKIRQLEIQLIVIAILTVTTVSTYFSVNSSGGPRYSFAPSIMIMLLVISSVDDKTIPKTLRYISTILIALSLINSLRFYRSNMLSGVAYDPAWPKWKEEISVWKTNHNYPIKIWPPGWNITLSGE